MKIIIHYFDEKGEDFEQPISCSMSDVCTRYKQDFVPSVGEQRFATCDCGNIQMGTKVLREPFPGMLQFTLNTSKPHIFQTDERKRKREKKSSGRRQR